MLEELIGDFDGTVQLVSHDRVFLDRVVTSALAFEGGGRVTEYVGGWQDYLRQSASTSNSQLPTPRVNPGQSRATSAVSASVARATATPRKLTFKEQRELDALPERIAALETELSALGAESESPEFYKAGGDRIRAALARIDDAARELESSVARWMELEERR